MSYFALSARMKEVLEEGAQQSVLEEEGLELLCIRFNSECVGEEGSVSVGSEGDGAARESIGLPGLETGRLQALKQLLEVQDEGVGENCEFDYLLLKPMCDEPAREVILLFHGLNESSWEKYLAWAVELHRSTGSAMLMFPIAFHMNRVPEAWRNPRNLYQVYRERQQLFPQAHSASFANAIISMRLQVQPQRFFYSGLQSFRDVVRLMVQIRRGSHPAISRKAQLNIFGYSIGALLSEILLMVNPGQFFSDSRAFLFCGGATMQEMNPVSKYILDSVAGEAIQSFYLQLLDQASRTAGYSDFFHSMDESFYFKSMLAYNYLREEREERLRQIAPQVMALPLTKDRVIPAAEVRRTLNGDSAIPIPIEELDFDYSYSHEFPFPLKKPHQKEVERAFSQVMGRAGEFLKKG